MTKSTGAGLGYVDIFDFSGNLVNRFASGGVLNAPWGIAIAPAGFGSLEGDVLIGNFGDGTINVFAPNGTSLAASEGPLMASTGKALAFPGLWSLVFGNGDADKPVTTLFYTAGFADQTDGVFGSITVATSRLLQPVLGWCGSWRGSIICPAPAADALGSAAYGTPGQPIVLLTRASIGVALRNSLAKLSPREQFGNAETLGVYLGTILATLGGLTMAFTATPGGPRAALVLAIAAWLWLGVLSANFVEALAVEWTRARAAALQSMQGGARARRLCGSDRRDYRLVDAGARCAGGISCWSARAASSPPTAPSSRGRHRSVKAR